MSIALPTSPRGQSIDPIIDLAYTCESRHQIVR
jgi:hypothetical protein